MLSQYNVSHDGDWTVLGFEMDCLIGVDIVDCRRQMDYTDLRQQFSAAEWQRIQAAKDPLREFYAFWCLKESYIKAVGSMWLF